jgi:hypothetical protein
VTWSEQFPPSFDVGDPNAGHMHFDAAGTTWYAPDGVTPRLQYDTATGTIVLTGTVSHATNADNSTNAVNLTGGGTASGDTTIAGSLIVGNPTAAHAIVGSDAHGADGFRLYAADGITPLIDLTIAGTPTIIGALIETAAAGKRIVMSTPGAIDKISFFSGLAGETQEASIVVGLHTATAPDLLISGGVVTGNFVLPQISVISDDPGLGFDAGGTIRLASKVIDLNLGNGFSSSSVQITRNGVAASLSDRPYAIAVQSNVQSVPNGAFTTITMDTLAFGSAGMALSGGGIQVTEVGVYQIDASVACASNAVGLRYIQLHAGGNDVAGRFNQQALNGDGNEMTISRKAVLAAGAIVQVQLFQTSGAALNTRVSGNVVSSIQVAKVA